DSCETPCDVVILATGYRLWFPFLSQHLIPVDANRISLYKDMFPALSPHSNTLAFIGLIQPIGTLLPISEIQCRWFVQLMAGKCRPLPAVDAMNEDIDKCRRYRSRRFGISDRHTIEVEPIDYMDDIAVQADVKPDIWRYFFTDFRLWRAMLFGPSLQYQYRLTGPHSWSGARDAILGCEDRIKAPTMTRFNNNCGDRTANDKPYNALYVLAIIEHNDNDYLLSEPLPESVRIEKADAHFYRIGLSLFKPAYPIKRSWFNHPLIVLIVLIQHLVKYLILIIIYVNKWEVSETMHIQLADIDHMMGTGVIHNVIVFVLDTFALTCMAIQYYNYKRGIKPRDLRVMEMLAGLVAPKTLGVNDRAIVAKLSAAFERCLQVIELLSITSEAMVFTIDIIGFSHHGGWEFIVCVGLPQSFWQSVWAHYMRHWMYYQTIYYFMIVYYLKLKLRFLNGLLATHVTSSGREVPKKGSRVLLVSRVTREYTEILNEIGDYNRIYWSSYLALISVTMVIAIFGSFNSLVVADVDAFHRAH
ncbi:unnamed protein product, partial [Medioppia subpectinata]